MLMTNNRDTEKRVASVKLLGNFIDDVLFCAHPAPLPTPGVFRRPLTTLGQGSVFHCLIGLRPLWFPRTSTSKMEGF